MDLDITNRQLLQNLTECIDRKINDAVRELRPNLLPIEDVCDILGITRRTFNRWQREDNVFPIVQYKQTRRVPRKAVDDFIRDNNININQN